MPNFLAGSPAVAPMTRRTPVDLIPQAKIRRAPDAMRTLVLMLFATFWLAAPAEAQETEFPPGAVDPGTGEFTVPVADNAEGDELCAAIQTDPEPYAGEETVVFTVGDDESNVDDVVCLRPITDDEKAGTSDEGDDVEAGLLVGGGALLLIAVGAAWSRVRA